jgi:hypothetical protein
MKNLQTNDLMALSFLIDDEIYLTNDERATIVAKEDSRPTEKEEIIENKIPILVAEKEEILSIPAPIADSNKDYKYLGENNKYILIIVKEPEADFLKPTDLTFLLKILAAKKLVLDDVAIINTEKNGALDFDNLKDYFACNKIITFGIDPKLLQITTAVANKKSIFKNTPILGTWDLQKLQLDPKKKGIFWDELKTF